jgi:hypothetical protein
MQRPRTPGRLLVGFRYDFETGLMGEYDSMIYPFIESDPDCYVAIITALKGVLNMPPKERPSHAHHLADFLSSISDYEFPSAIEPPTSGLQVPIFGWPLVILGDGEDTSSPTDLVQRVRDVIPKFCS